MNLLQETIRALHENGKLPRDVEWVGNKAGYITWQEFEKLADRDYDDGYGQQFVNPSLVVVGDSWWLERHEYDGSEWWEFKTLPRKGKHIKFTQVISNEEYWRGEEKTARGKDFDAISPYIVREEF